MPVRSREANIDFSIQGDELEHHRIQLEQNLQHTDISLHLSSSAPEDNDEDHSDIEYPRHNSAPVVYDGFASFDHHSRDHFDPADEHSHYNAWSYRTMDEDEGISPYDGRTMSTAAHHASALTLSAGLGGRGSRRDVSISGAEYDPDRPLQGIIAGFGHRIPGLDADSTKSKHYLSTTVDFDPLVVDDSAEVERVFAHGRAPVPQLVAGLRSPSSTSSSSRPSTPMSPRPKLSDALHQVAFSPKRPRSAPTQAATRAVTQPSVVRHLPAASRKPSTRAKVTEEEDAPTPKLRNRNSPSFSRIYQQSLSYAAPMELEVNVHPPTPSSSENPSRFTRMARGLAQEIKDERLRQDHHAKQTEKAAFAQSTVREKRVVVKTDSNKVPLRSVVSELKDPVQGYVAPARSAGMRTPMKGKVYLPDVTGLTSIVASPAKLKLDYMAYNGKDDVELDVRLATTLNVVQSKLAYLESENGISRRRVRELELELEECKKQVVRERTKVIEREQVDYDAHVRAGPSKRGLRNVVIEEEDEDGDISRYKEAVEEKKALEALISTLRSHLSRLTAELSEHRSLLQELRTLRDSDARALKEKSHDVNQLRQEVERLSGEVEVLRGVVEEGLKERREAREQAEGHSRSGSFHIEHDAEDLEEVGVAAVPLRKALVESEDEDADETRSGRSTPSPRPSPSRARDRTVHTDQATHGSPSMAPQPFITQAEIDRIAEEVSERRSERSNSDSTYSLRRAEESSESSQESATETADPPKVNRAGSPVREQAPAPEQPEARRPSSPKAHRDRRAKRPASCASTEAPFPQIRGEFLERLFFSAPEHNAQTCTVCNRRQRARATTTYHRRRSCDAGPQHDEDDEGFAEGEDGRFARAKHGYKGKGRADGDEEVPPQTVIARVLRELEDDFTHYKGIYVELAGQYAVIDAVSNVAKRNVLAEHLREVIDILEQKGDQIASLYDLLTFKDKPVAESVVPVPERPTAPEKLAVDDRHTGFSQYISWSHVRKR